MPRGGARPRANPLAAQDPSHVEKRKKNNDAVKKTREKHKLENKELDEKINIEKRLFDFNSKKIEAVRTIMDKISNVRQANLNPVQVEEIKKNFLADMDQFIPIMHTIAQNIDVLSNDAVKLRRIPTNHASSQRDILLCMMDFLSHLFQLQCKSSEDTQQLQQNLYNVNVPQSSNQFSS